MCFMLSSTFFLNKLIWMKSDCQKLIQKCFFEAEIINAVVIFIEAFHNYWSIRFKYLKAYVVSFVFGLSFNFFRLVLDGIW